MVQCSKTLHVPASGTNDIGALAEVLGRRRSITVISGAGISTDSGIPDYRDVDGNWKNRAPVMFRDFVDKPEVRRRYWARSMSGWPRIERARPATAHRALAALEASGHLNAIVTQNVDDLHRRAGTRRLVDLHGRLSRVRCLDCGRRCARASFQHELLKFNSDFESRTIRLAPDGDVDLEDADYSAFKVPPCLRCGGLLKPDVTFYGETIPAARTRQAEIAVSGADAVLVIGSSLMVFSAYRLVRNAARAGIPVYALNLGRTRADDLFAGKIAMPVCESVPALVDEIAGVWI